MAIKFDSVCNNNNIEMTINNMNNKLQEEENNDGKITTSVMPPTNTIRDCIMCDPPNNSLSIRLALDIEMCLINSKV